MAIDSSLTQRSTWSDRPLFVLGTVLVFLQGTAIVAGLMKHWLYVLLPWVVILFLTALLAPRLGLFLAALALYVRVPIPYLSGTYSADLFALAIIGGTIASRVAAGQSPLAPTKLRLPYLVILVVFALSLLKASFLNPAVVNWLRHLELFAFALAVGSIVTRRDVRRLLHLLLIMASVTSVFNIFSFIATGGSLRIFGPAGAYFPLYLSLALGLTSVMALTTARASRAVIWFALTLLLFFGQVATMARAAWLQAALSIAVLAAVLWYWAGRHGYRYIRRRISVLMATGIGIAILFMTGSIPIVQAPMLRVLRAFAGTSNTLNLREFMWKTGLSAFAESPLWGIGLGQAQRWDEILTFWRFDPRSPATVGLGIHNDAITYLAETGVFGTAAVLWLFWRVLRIGPRQLARTSSIPRAEEILTVWIPLCGVIFAFFFGTHTFYSLSGIIIAIYFGLLICVCERTETDPIGTALVRRPSL